MKAVTLIIILLYLVSSSYAGPESTNLSSFKVLIPDYSKTSGGTQPAVSPDGKTLVYKSQRSDIWVLHSEETLFKSVDPWKLDIPDVDLSDIKTLSTSYGDGLPRGLDWSPDEKKLAIGGDALFVAEDFDYIAKTAKVRVLAKLRLSEGDDSVGEIESPRWSPDGKQIAFIRTRSPGSSIVCVVDYETGKETELAQDASEGTSVWNQPWSPDGKYIVYNSHIHYQGEGDMTETTPKGTYIVSIDGKLRRKIVDDDYAHSPDWCMKSDRIALAARRDYEVKGSSGSKINGTHGVVLVTDSRGSKPEILYKEDLPTAEQADKYKKYTDTTLIRQLRLAFKKEFGPLIPPAMNQRLEAGELTEEEITEFSLLTAARETDDAFYQLLKARMSSAGEEDIWNDPELKEALQALPQDKKDQFGGRSLGWMVDLYMDAPYPMTESDSRPVWSPNGTKFLMVRGDFISNHQTLMIVDISTRESYQIFTAYRIDCMSWTNNESVVIQATRLLGQEETGGHLKTNTPSYPEIWLLQPKLPESGHITWGVPCNRLNLGLRIWTSGTVVANPVNLEIIVANTGSEAIKLIETCPEFDFNVVVKDQKGKDVPLTDWGKQMMKSKESGARWRCLDVDLAPYSQKTYTYRLADMFDLKRPGEYTIQVTRHMPTNDWAEKCMPQATTSFSLGN